MDKLTYQLKQLCKSNRDGSFATQADRRRHLQLFARQLKELGYRNMGVQSLKTRHVNALVDYWKTECVQGKEEPISIATLKNRTCVLRWWAGKINKQNVVPRTNAELGIGARKRLPDENKAFRLSPEKISSLPHYLQQSLRLQQEFGLRREEASKFIPSYAIYPDEIQIKASWAKGGRARNIPITTESQKELIEELKQHPRGHSMIPARFSYRKYLAHRQWHLYQIGLKDSHGLRHHYAQARYQVLTGGILPPRLGGPKRGELKGREKELGIAARVTISRELGHSRLDITRVYLG